MSGSDTNRPTGDENEQRPLPPPDATDSPHPVSGAAPADADLRGRFGAAAMAVDTGAAGEALSSVRATAKRRRRRRNGLVGVAAAGLLVASSAVVALLIGDDDGDDLIVSTPITEETDDEPSDEAAGDDEAGGSSREPGDEAQPADAPAPPPVATVTEPAESTVVVDGAAFVGSEQIVPWKGGFLAMRQEFTPQPLPADLPEEITALFPDEVVQFFEDSGGLPATIDEAINMLQEAGLLDEVSDVVNEHRDAFDAIYSIPAPAPTVSARTSPDGLEWTDVDLALPEGVSIGYRTISTGERLVVLTEEFAELPALDPASSVFPVPSGPVSATLWWTTDLVTWLSYELDLSASDRTVSTDPARPADPEYVFTETHVGGVAVNEDRWVLSLHTFETFEPSRLLPAEVLEQIDGEHGYGFWHDEDGVTVEIIDADGSSTEFFTWAELGVEPPPADMLAEPYGPPIGRTYSATWGAEPTVTESDPGFGQVVAWDGGFVHQHESGVSVSTDGIALRATTGLPTPDDGWVAALMPVPGSVVAFVGAPMNTGVSTYQLDATSLSWAPIEVPGLPEGFATWSQPTTAAMLYTVETFAEFEDVPVPEPFVASYEHDGYQLDLMVGIEGSSYSLVDLASGEVVSTESVPSDPATTPFERLVEQGDGSITFVESETGEEIVTIPVEVIDATNVDLEGNLDSGAVVEPIPSEEIAEEWYPEFGILATDGSTWINESVDFGGEFGPAGDPVIVDGVVLVPNVDGTHLRFEF